MSKGRKSLSEEERHNRVEWKSLLKDFSREAGNPPASEIVEHMNKTLAKSHLVNLKKIKKSHVYGWFHIPSITDDTNIDLRIPSDETTANALASVFESRLRANGNEPDVQERLSKWLGLIGFAKNVPHKKKPEIYAARQPFNKDVVIFSSVYTNLSNPMNADQEEGLELIQTQVKNEKKIFVLSIVDTKGPGPETPPEYFTIMAKSFKRAIDSSDSSLQEKAANNIKFVAIKYRDGGFEHCNQHKKVLVGFNLKPSTSDSENMLRPKYDSADNCAGIVELEQVNMISADPKKDRDDKKLLTGEMELRYIQDFVDWFIGMYQNKNNSIIDTVYRLDFEDNQSDLLKV